MLSLLDEIHLQKPLTKNKTVIYLSFSNSTFTAFLSGTLFSHLAKSSRISFLVGEKSLNRLHALGHHFP
jgi:hypothetical protein